ncbi:MAG: hypothetical protein KTV77_02165 [Wolbachia endosymbiont of Fragariocoptes setiger]|nr:hypothetical protein [Wolbachia endosymbiont of Fragariocoptes setiger]
MDKIKKLTFQKTIAEMIQDKSVVKAIQVLVENQKILDISSKDIERCVEKGKSTFDEDKEDFKALVEKISAAAQKSFSKIGEFKEEVEKVQKENSPNTKLEVNTKSVEQVNDNNIEK